MTSSDSFIAEDKTLPVADIYPNPDQPRKVFDEEGLSEMAENIRRYGILQPLVVTPRNESHMIIAGERRWRASQLAGLTHLPVRVIIADDTLVEELALIENLLRKDLTILEEAKAYQALIDKGMTEEELAAKLGMKQVWRITERTSLLSLAGDFQDLVRKGVITPSQAFEMSRVPLEQQMIVFRQIKAGKLDNYTKLRSFVSGLLDIGKTGSMFQECEVTEEERQMVTRYEKMIEQVTRLVANGFKDNEMVVLQKMLKGNLQVNLQKIELLMRDLKKIHKALETAQMKQEALDLSA